MVFYPISFKFSSILLKNKQFFTILFIMTIFSKTYILLCAVLTNTNITKFNTKRAILVNLILAVIGIHIGVMCGG